MYDLFAVYRWKETADKGENSEDSYKYLIVMRLETSKPNWEVTVLSLGYHCMWIQFIKS